MAVHQNEVVIYKGHLQYCSSRVPRAWESDVMHIQISTKSPQVPTSFFIIQVYKAIAGLSKNKTMISLQLSILLMGFDQKGSWGAWIFLRTDM